MVIFLSMGFGMTFAALTGRSRPHMRGGAPSTASSFIVDDIHHRSLMTSESAEPLCAPLRLVPDAPPPGEGTRGDSDGYEQDHRQDREAVGPAGDDRHPG